MTDALNALLEPIRQEYANNPEFQKSFELAYLQPGKKVKKVKDKGSRYPGNNPNMKTTKERAEVLASEGAAKDITANGQGIGSGGQSKAQIQGAGKGIENALNKLNVSDTPQ